MRMRSIDKNFSWLSFCAASLDRLPLALWSCRRLANYIDMQASAGTNSRAKAAPCAQGPRVVETYMYLNLLRQDSCSCTLKDIGANERKIAEL